MLPNYSLVGSKNVPYLQGAGSDLCRLRREKAEQSWAAPVLAGTSNFIIFQRKGVQTVDLRVLVDQCVLPAAISSNKTGLIQVESSKSTADV